MYDGPEAHQALLEDSARCAAFADAIAAAAPLLKGRVVLDAGCGAGLLSLLLAAEAGAAHVYAVDASAGACELARRVVKANGLEARVTVIHARIEAVSLPVDKVDAIVCDWMGAALLHDSLLPALAACRDRWLAPGGLMLPDVAALFVMGVDDRQHLADKRAFWHARQMVRPRPGWFFGALLCCCCFWRPAGLRLLPFSPPKPHFCCCGKLTPLQSTTPPPFSSARLAQGDFDFSSVLNAVVRHPRQDTLARPRSQAVTGAARVLGLDLYKATQADLTFAAPFELSAQREGRVSALLAYFDVAFTCRGRFAAPAVLGAASAGGKAAAESSGSSGGGSGGQAAATAQGGGGGSGEAVVLTTHPLAPATGWLQTLFSFPRALQLAKGDALAGSFAVRPAGRPVGRMLDVNVEVKFQGATAKVAYAMRRPLQRTL